MITLYYLENSRAFRVLWLLNELQLEHELKVYSRIGGKKAPASMTEDSGFKLGKSPCIRDGDVLVSESAAILTYLVERYGASSGLLPSAPDWQKRADVQSWMSFAEGTLMLHCIPVTYSRWFLEDEPEVQKSFIDKLSANVQNDFDHIEATLQANEARHGKTNGEGAFLVGESLTVADIQMEYALISKNGTEGKGWPHVERWLRGLEARSAYQATLQAAEYKYVLP